MPKKTTGQNVFDRALERIEEVYSGNNRVVVSFSAGKDSGVILELAIMAARKLGKLPVEVSFFDEEIMYPGTWQYAERTAARPEVKFRWFANHTPQLNAFNRECPYWWTFDPLLPEEDWVRSPPADLVEWIEDEDVPAVTSSRRFPPGPGQDLVVIVGIRATESMNRRMAVFSSQGHMTKVTKYGSRLSRPIFDWGDGDIWKAIGEQKWDYNDAYKVMYKLGVDRSRLRIAPPAMTPAAVGKLSMAQKAWPKWFDKVSQRLHGVKTAAMFGKRAVEPQRRLGESWQECYVRTCITDAPPWISERAQAYMVKKLHIHSIHSTQPLNEIVRCPQCYRTGSWKLMAKAMFFGDPFCLKDKPGQFLKPVEPSVFRPGAPSWWKTARQLEKERKAKEKAAAEAAEKEAAEKAASA